jgi:hypothetical protein
MRAPILLLSALLSASSLVLGGCSSEASAPEETAPVVDEPAPVQPPSSGGGATTAPDNGGATTGAPAAGAAPAAPAAPDAPAVLRRGTFVDKDYEGSGSAMILRAGADAAPYLRLESFSTSAGPALHVLLTKVASPSSAADVAKGSVDLGALRGFKGNLTYPLPAGVDVTQYAGVIVYCVDYDVVFTAAALDAP